MSFTKFYFIDHCDNKFKVSLISAITDLRFICVTTNMDLKASFVANELMVGNLKNLMDEVPNNILARDIAFLVMGTSFNLRSMDLEVIKTSATIIVIINEVDNNEIKVNHFENIKAILKNILDGKILHVSDNYCVFDKRPKYRLNSLVFAIIKFILKLVLYFDYLN